MTEEIKDWGCPKWRDAKAYPTCPDELTNAEWRWEFLRRMPSYRSLWNELPPFQEFSPDDSWRKLGDAGRSNIHMKAIWKHDLVQLMRNPKCSDPGENQQAWLRKGGGVLKPPPREWFEGPHANSNKKGPKVTPEPNQAQRYEQDSKRLRWLLDLLENYALLENPSSPYVYVQFDLGRRISQQVELAHIALKDMAELKRSPRLDGTDRTRWPLYLRLLDAADQENPKVMVIYKRLLKEAEKSEAALYDKLCVKNPATKIMDWQESALQLRKKAAFYL